MKILVCGGRDYSDDVAVAMGLGFYIKPGDRRRIVIQGGASGADRLAKLWCERNDVHCAEVRALWNGRHGKAAGPIRNEAMLILEPDVVLAFPGGAGTESMVSLAQERGIYVRRWAAAVSASPTQGAE